MVNIKNDFPILSRKINGKQLVYLDNSATSQKPKQVIKAVTDYYYNYNSNIHRAIHTIGEEATREYEKTRGNIAGFINAKTGSEIVFVRNATEAINLVMYSYARNNLKKGDEIIATVMEHHSNIVPWQQLRKQGVKLNFVDINDEGELDIKQMEKLVSNKTKLIAVTHVSNVLGTINDIKKIAKIAHEHNALLLVDAAQSAPHIKIDVQDMDADFLAISGHKMMAPMGIGVLYVKQGILDKMEPFLFGGDMIKEVSLEEASWNELPWRFEAGTPNVAGVIGLNAAVDYLKKIGMDNVRKHELELTKYALNEMSKIKNVKVYGGKDASKRAGVISFNVNNVHSHDVATILDSFGIAIRSGHNCAQPLMKRLNVSSVARASFYVYNTKDDVDKLVAGLKEVERVFKL